MTTNTVATIQAQGERLDAVPEFVDDLPTEPCPAPPRTITRRERDLARERASTVPIPNETLSEISESFRAEIRAQSSVVENRPGSVYKRLETDQELRARLVARGVYAYSKSGYELDQYAWDQCRLERRIIEVVP
jgi:hypothetical protein